MKYLSLLALLPFLFTSCADDEAPTEALDVYGILGNWTLLNTYSFEAGRTVFIDDLAVDYGFIHLIADEELDDLKGNFEKEEFGQMLSGTFTLNPEEGEIRFVREGKGFLAEYELTDDQLRISRQVDSTIIVEDYQKEK